MALKTNHFTTGTQIMFFTGRINNTTGLEKRLTPSLYPANLPHPTPSDEKLSVTKHS